jgi:F-type H+-transporting ATPase subunit epsilon
MSKTIQCDIVSAEREFFSGPVLSIVLVGVLGDFGVLPGHAPLITKLIPGPARLVYADTGEEELYYLSGGVVEVQPHIVTVLADTVVRAHDLDEAAALEAQAAAERLIHQQQSDVDLTQVSAQFLNAVAQLRTLNQLKKRLGR